MTSENFQWINSLRLHLKKAAAEEDLRTGFDRNGIQKRIREIVDLYEFSPAGYLNLDKAGNIRSANLTATVILRTSRSELIGQSLYPFVRRQDRDTLFLHLRHIFKEKKPKSCELRINGPHDKPQWVRLDSIYDADFPVAPQIRTMLIDIDYQKQTQTKLAHLAVIVQSSADAIIRQDPHGIITHWNPAAGKIFGYSAAEAVGRPIEMIIPANRRGEDRRLVRRVSRGQPVVSEEIVRLTKDGMKINVAVTMSAIYDEQNRFLGAVSIERDITERVKNRLRLNRIREELQMATSAAQVGTWFADFGRRTSQWNDQLYRLLGMDPRPGPEDIEYFFSFIHPDDRKARLENTQTMIDSGASELIDEFRIIREDGQIRWLAVRGKIIRNTCGEPVQMAGVNFDITEIKEAREAEQIAQMQLTAKVAQLEQKNQELDQFAYAASHDLKAPLRAIRNYSDFLYEDLAESLSGEQKGYLEGLKFAVDQGQNLIDDLLAYSRIGRTAATSERVDMSALINEVKSYLNLSSEIELTVQDDWPVLEVDVVLVSMILKNLVGNAVKFNSSPSKRVHIGWRQPKKDGSVEIFVRDNGVGIDPQYQQQIFGIFQRLHTAKEYEGTGIGLAIVKKAAHELGGRVRVASVPGEGSTFYVEIPNRVES